MLAALVLSRERGLGHRLNHVGLALGVAWLAFTVVAKTHVGRVADDSLPSGVTRVFTTPTPLNAVLWRVVAMTGDERYLEGYYSLLDPEPRVSFASRADGHALLDPLRNEAAVARLMWFSRSAGARTPRSRPDCGPRWGSGSSVARRNRPASCPAEAEPGQPTAATTPR